MKKRLSNSHFIHFCCLVACIGFVSCSLFENNRQAPDLNIWGSYQIGNSSSQDVVLHFYSKGKPMAVYAEIYNQSNPIFVSQENSIKEISELIHTDKLPLKAGQTALFYSVYYSQKLTQPHEVHQASCLSNLGYGNAYNNLSNVGLPVIGNRVVMSIEGQTDSILPLQERDLWETWYDEKYYIYYHFWRID